MLRASEGLLGALGALGTEGTEGTEGAKGVGVGVADHQMNFSKSEGFTSDMIETTKLNRIISIGNNIYLL